MRARAIYFRVGLLIVIGIGVVVALVLFLTGERFRNAVAMETYFNESVQGLTVGAPVRFLGVTVGRVTDIGLVSAEYFRNAPISLRRATYRMVVVRFVVVPERLGRSFTPERIAAAVKAGFRARTVSQAITGISYLGLDFVNPEQFPAEAVPWKPRFPYVPSVPSTFSQVQSAAEQLAEQFKTIDFKAIATSLLALLEELRTELKSGDTHQTLAAKRTLVETLNQQVQQADLPGLVAGIKEDTKSLSALLEGGKLEQIGTNADKAAAEVAEVVRTLPPLINALSRTAARTDATTADFERRMIPILRDLAATAANLRDTASALRAYPAGVLFGGPPPRPANSNRGGGR